jgi:hypothetical protein
VLAAHACDPSYSGGRDQEDLFAQANSLWDTYLEKPFTKKGWWSALRCRPWVQTQYHHHQKRKKKMSLDISCSGRKFLKREEGVI